MPTRNSLAAMPAGHGINSETTTAASRLPPETLAHIFMHVDPHTLYTSVRSLSRSWRACVEKRLLADEFASGRWRVGLRVVRKPKTGKVWQGGVAGREGTERPGARWHECAAHIQKHAQGSDEEKANVLSKAREQYIDHVMSRPGALEDELTPLRQSTSSAAEPLVHVVPLHFQEYDGEATVLRFATPTNHWQALFEHNHGDGSVDANTGRLDLDFGIVWRFPGDGQGDDEWGVPDQENGWLSRFYCSSFDVQDAKEEAEASSSTHTLQSTPLARRIRRAIYTAPDASAHTAESEARTSTVWADDGHEYASLSLSLGTEFFVRRSARANFLLRRLEAEVQAGEVRDRSAQSFSLGRSSTSTKRASAASKGLLTRHDMLSASTSASSVASSGASTPLPPWSRSNGRSFADVASTPAAGASSYGKMRGYASTGASTPLTRSSGNDDKTMLTQALQRRLAGLQAPSSSAAGSGYSSVLHQSPVDAKSVEAQKRAEAADAQTDDEHDKADTTSPDALSSRTSQSVSRQAHSPPSKVLGASSGQRSLPRAHFTARLVRPTADKHWRCGDVWGRGAIACIDQVETTSTWEWTR